MGNNKIGRNDPCPCGSGKKFKHCCQALDEAPGGDLFTRYSQAIAGVKLKLDEAYKANIKRVRKEARQNFLHYTIDRQLATEQESIFSDWLWFDRLDEDGTSLASDYLNQHQVFMPLPLKNCLNALSISYLSVYEPSHIGDSHLELKDIFSQTLHQVMLKEALDADLNEKPLLLLGRLVNLGEGQVFSGMVLAADNNDGQADYLRQHISYLAAVKKEPEGNLLLKANADILFGLFDHILRKKHIAINDIRCLKLTAPKQRDAIRERLENTDQMCFMHTQAGLRWYQGQPEGGNKTIAVAADYVISCASSLEDLACWPAILGDEAPPPHEWQLVNSNFLRQSPPPALLSIWFNVLQEQETERWLHTSHRELDNKSPLEKVAEENGIQPVLDMLDLFAARFEEGNEGLALIAYMRERIQTMDVNLPAI